MSRPSISPKSRPQIALQSLEIFAAGIVLTGFFIYQGFPYERLADQLSQQIEDAQHVQVRYGKIGPQMYWQAPGLLVTDVSALPKRGNRFTLDEISLRPAWSFSWLLGEPSLYVEGTAGDARGGMEITLGEPLRVRGEISDLDLQPLPVPGALAKASLSGIGTLEFDLQKPTEESWQGTARLWVRDGSFAPPDLNLALPYTSLRSTLTLTPDGFVEIEGAQLEGPILSGTASGRIGAMEGSQPVPLDLDLEFEVTEPSIQEALRANKIPVSEDGHANFHFGGTLAKPSIH